MEVLNSLFFSLSYLHCFFLLTTRQTLNNIPSILQEDSIICLPELTCQKMLSEHRCTLAIDNLSSSVLLIHILKTGPTTSIMPVTSIASPFVLHCLENVHQKQGSKRNYHNAPLMFEWACPSSCNNRATLQSFGNETYNSPYSSPSMKTFISCNQLQNKSLRQILSCLHFSSSPFPLNTKCPWFKRKARALLPPFKLCSLPFPLESSKNSQEGLKMSVKHFCLSNLLWTFCLFVCWDFIVEFLYKIFKRHLIVWAHSYWIFGKAYFWLLKDDLNS